ncbi:hypothetical protein ON010_g18522 [Phytophthora cinnamomi]|nr:hypothetical protein ON010_g18522 [Phytophthora cinnamomi]
MRAAQDSSVDPCQTEKEIGDDEISAIKEVDELRRRFDVIVSSCDDKPLPTDPHTTRTNARAAFLEYMRTIPN